MRGQCREYAFPDGLDAANPGYVNAVRRVYVTTFCPRLIILNQRFGLFVIDRQAGSYSRCLIVWALYEFFPGKVILVNYFWRVEGDVIGAA